MRLVCRLLTVVAVVVLTAACAIDRPVLTATPRPTTNIDSPPAAPTPVIGWATWPDTIVLRMQSYLDHGAPGFFDYRSAPAFSLYGDGRVIFAPVDDAGAARAVLPSMLEGRLTPEGMRIVLDLTRASRLLSAAGASYPTQAVSDAPTTVFSALTVDGWHKAWVYALGSPETSPDPMDPNGREELTTFASQLRGLRLAIDASELTVAGLYRPTAIHLFIQPFEVLGSIQPVTRPWPLGDLASFGRIDLNDQGVRCVAITGSDLTTILPLLREATDTTAWSSSSHTYRLSVDPLLPDESGAPCTFGESAPHGP